MLFNLLIVALLMLFNGLLAMSELAVVSARKARLQAMQRRGVRGARAAARLKQEPGRFLSTVQIGITLVGVLAGAFSGATLAEPLARTLRAAGWGGEWSDELALTVVVGAITYLSLIVGELVPKQIALRNPERIAAAVAPAMLGLSRLTHPLVRLLDWSSALLLRLLPAHGPTPRVTDEEIHAIVSEAASSGVVEPEERRMITAVMRLADRSVRAVMTPRIELDWIDLDAPVGTQRAQLRASRHSTLIAAHGDVDEFVGLISAKALVDAVLDGAGSIEPAAHVHAALVLPDSIDALDAIAKLKRAISHAAILVDEFGSLQGLVTVTDILSAIAGEFELDTPPPGMIEQADGSWLVDGDLPAGELADQLQIKLPNARDYETVAGLMLDLLGHLPQRGDSAQLQGWTIDARVIDGNRIDKVVVRPTPAKERPAGA
ncbi:MAG: hemolysin family protein [Nevskiales bacterium]|nr:hemolysin family protein [Nevskiales bacterium]